MITKDQRAEIEDHLQQQPEATPTDIMVLFGIPEKEAAALLKEIEANADGLTQPVREESPEPAPAKKAPKKAASAKKVAAKAKGKRAHEEDGTFKADDPSTPDKNEAYDAKFYLRDPATNQVVELHRRNSSQNVVVLEVATFG